MKEKITIDNLITDIKSKNKKAIIGLIIGFSGIAALAAYALHTLGWLTILYIILSLLVVGAIVSLIIVGRGSALINHIKRGEIDIYEDMVTKKTMTRGGRGILYYLVFKHYQSYKGPGVAVSDVEYDACELDDTYYIVCVKRTLTNPYVIVYPTGRYMLSDELEKEVRK